LRIGDDSVIWVTKLQNLGMHDIVVATHKTR